MIACDRAGFRKDVMKKDDKQSGNRKKPQKKSAGKPLSAKKKPAPKYFLDLEAIGKESEAESGIVLPKNRGLTLGQWQELAKKDPSLLSSQEARQLAETNKMAADFAIQLSERYDFASLFKTTPVLKMVEDIGKAASATKALHMNLAIPAQQLVNFQRSMTITSSVISQVMIDAANMANITHSLFAGFESWHTQFIKSLSIDIASLGSTMARITAVETIDFDVLEIGEKDGHIVVKSETSQVQRIDDYELVSKANLDLLFTEFRATRSELAEIKDLINKGLQPGISKIAFADAKFKREASNLIINGFDVVVGRNSKQAQFCELFFKSEANFSKKWDIQDFVNAAFGLQIGLDGNEEQMLSLVKGYVHALNQKIVASTKGKFKDFFVLVKLEVYINPEYTS